MTDVDAAGAAPAGSTGYHWAQKALHWTVAAALIVAIPLGVLIADFSEEEVAALLGVGKGPLYDWHKSVGLLVLMLMTARVGFRLAFGAPAYDRPLAPHERIASAAVHAALYVLLIATPALGWAATSAFGPNAIYFFGWTLPDPIAKDPDLSKALFQAHRACAIGVFVLSILHIGAAIYHGAVKRDGVLLRMLR